MYTGAITLQYL